MTHAFRCWLMALALVWLSAREAQAVGFLLSLDGQTAHEFETWRLRRSLAGFSGSAALQWKTDNYAFVVSLRVRRFSMRESQNLGPFRTLATPMWGVDHSFHLWRNVVGTNDGTQLFVGPAIGWSYYESCQFDACDDAGAMAAVELGARTPLTRRSAFVVLLSVASHIDDSDMLTLMPGLSMGIEL